MSGEKAAGRGPARAPEAPQTEQPRPRDEAVQQGGRPAGVEEHGGPRGLEPTRYGDWEKNGRCTDF